MPQKRNPVAIEHARAIGSKALGQAQAIVTAVHNTPFGDIVDTEDDLQPLVFAMFRDATRAVKLVAAAMPTAEFDARALEARAGDGWTTLTELADTLVRDHGTPVQDRARDRRAVLDGARSEHPERRWPARSRRVSTELLGAPLTTRRASCARSSARATSSTSAGRSAARRRKRPRAPASVSRAQLDARPARGGHGHATRSARPNGARRAERGALIDRRRRRADDRRARSRR